LGTRCIGYMQGDTTKLARPFGEIEMEPQPRGAGIAPKKWTRGLTTQAAFERAAASSN
jgi:hypothetical protein